MEKIFIFAVILGLFSGFCEAEEKFIISKLNIDQYTIEITDDECRGLPLQLNKDKFLQDWAYSTLAHHGIVDKSSFGEEKFILCLIKLIKSSGYIINGTNQIRIRFELEFLNGVFSYDGKIRKSMALLKGTVKNNDFSFVKFFSREIASYSTMIDFCNAISEFDFFCGDNFIDMNPPIFGNENLGLKRNKLASLEHFGLPKELWISLTLSSKSKSIGILMEQPVSK